MLSLVRSKKGGFLIPLSVLLIFSQLSREKMKYLPHSLGRNYRSFVLVAFLWMVQTAFHRFMGHFILPISKLGFFVMSEIAFER